MFQQFSVEHTTFTAIVMHASNANKTLRHCPLLCLFIHRKLCIYYASCTHNETNVHLITQVYAFPEAKQVTISILHWKIPQSFNPSRFVLGMLDHYEVWQVNQQHCCWGTCQISKWFDYFITLSWLWYTVRPSDNFLCDTEISPRCLQMMNKQGQDVVSYSSLHIAQVKIYSAKYFHYVTILSEISSRL